MNFFNYLKLFDPFYIKNHIRSIYFHRIFRLLQFMLQRKQVADCCQHII